MTILPQGLVIGQANRCPDEWVVDVDGGCVLPDQISVVTYDPQSRADLEAAIAIYDGEITFAWEGKRSGIYSVRFPVDDLGELGRIRDVLISSGFSAGFTPMGTLFA
jgi:hypothetical protein